MSRVASAVVVVIVLFALAGCGGGSGNSKTGYVKGNSGLLAKLPLYPHSKLTTQGTTAYTTGTKKIAGYQTRYIYRLPKAASTSSVESWYLQQMPQAGWKQVASLSGPVLNYRKGKAFVSVNLTESNAHRLELLVDNAFFSHTSK